MKTAERSAKSDTDFGLLKEAMDSMLGVQAVWPNPSPLMLRVIGKPFQFVFTPSKGTGSTTIWGQIISAEYLPDGTVRLFVSSREWKGRKLEYLQFDSAAAKWRAYVARDPSYVVFGSSKIEPAELGMLTSEFHLDQDLV